MHTYLTAGNQHLCPVRPEHIRDRGDVGDFGNQESEHAASWIVRLCRQRQTWAPFTHGEITELFNGDLMDMQFRYARLAERGFIRFIGDTDDGRPKPETVVELTLAFVARCYVRSHAPLAE